LGEVAGALAAAPVSDFGSLPALPLALAILPIGGGVLAVLYARARNTRHVPTWTCGSDVTRRAQYSASAFAGPLRRIVARVIPRSSERAIGAIVQRLARSTRIVQSGLLRVYVAYAVGAVILVLALAR